MEMINNKTYFLKTLSVGCPKNMIESSTYRSILEENGYSEVEEKNNANIVIYNTCGCLEVLQSRARTAASSTDVREHEKVIVAGCFPFIDKGNTLAKDGYEIFEPGDYNQFKKILGISEGLIVESSDFNLTDYSEQPKLVNFPVKVYEFLKSNFKNLINNDSKVSRFFKSIMMTNKYFYLTLGAGCSGNCTFCGIKSAIGDPKSRSLGEILSKFQKAIDSGKKNIWLVSDDIGSWGKDLNTNTSTLLGNLLNNTHQFNIVLNYFEPDMLLNQWEKVSPFLLDKRVEQVCIPLQTGSQKLLKKMGRHYNIKEVLKAVKKIRKDNKSIVVKSQFIIGFPGETWKDFIMSLYAISKFDGVGVNAYARLKYTAAYNLKPLPNIVVKLRTIIAKSFAFIMYSRVLIS